MTRFERSMMAFEIVLGAELVFLFAVGLYGADWVGPGVADQFRPIGLPMVFVAVCAMMLARLGRKNSEEARREETA